MQDFFLSKQFGVAFNLNFKLHYLHSSSCTVLLNQKLFVQKSKTPFKNMKLVCCFTSSTLLNGFCLSVYSFAETTKQISIKLCMQFILKNCTTKPEENQTKSWLGQQLIVQLCWQPPEAPQGTQQPTSLRVHLFIYFQKANMM